jgi:hypothetical protein
LAQQEHIVHRKSAEKESQVQGKLKHFLQFVLDFLFSVRVWGTQNGPALVGFAVKYDYTWGKGYK